MPRTYRIEPHKLRRLVAGSRIPRMDQVFGVKKHFIRYWRRKTWDSSFHPNQQGGAKNIKFSNEE